MNEGEMKALMDTEIVLGELAQLFDALLTQARNVDEHLTVDGDGDPANPIRQAEIYMVAITAIAEKGKDRARSEAHRLFQMRGDLPF